MTGRPTARAAEVLSDHRCHLGEGVTYDPVTGTAWWFDILERRLFEARMGTGEMRAHALPFMASALAMVDGDRQLVAAEDGVYLRRRADGALTLLAGIAGGPVPLRSNDGRAHPAGTFWFSTMGRRAEPGAGAIFAYCRGAVHRLFDRLTIPNAICFSADGATGFFADTARHALYRVALDPRSGLPAGEPVLAFAHADGGGLDGAVIDAAGRLWIARWGGGAVDVFTAEGHLVDRIAVPARQPSCPAFAGPNLDRLVVTSALEGMSEEEREADPQGGMTFVVQAGCAGRPEPRVRLA